MVYNMHPSWPYSISYWMGCQDGNRWDPETKSIKMLYNDATWLEYYKLMNKWYRDGILVKDYLGVRPEDFFSRNESDPSIRCCVQRTGMRSRWIAKWREDTASAASMTT